MGTKKEIVLKTSRGKIKVDRIFTVENYDIIKLLPIIGYTYMFSDYDFIEVGQMDRYYLLDFYKNGNRIIVVKKYMEFTNY